MNRPALLFFLLFLQGHFLNAQNWTIVDPAITQSRLEDIVFPTPDLGFVVGPGGIYRSRDGGHSWKMVHRRNAFFRSVEFIDSLTGFAGTLNASLFQTTDGGNNWSNITSRIPGPVAGICGLAKVDSHLIAGVGTFDNVATLIRSRDKGLSWTHQDLSDVASSLVEVVFLDTLHGLIGGMSREGTHAVVLRTEDGGQTWTPVYTSNRALEYVWKMDVVNDSLIYASIENLSFSDCYILKSTDGGRTWKEQLVTNGNFDLQGIGFLNELEGWVAPRRFSLFHTTDGGNSWTGTFGPSNINRIIRVGENKIFAVGTYIHRYQPESTGIVPPDSEIILPEIRQLSPNPARNQATVDIQIPEGSSASVGLYDANGKWIRNPFPEKLNPGAHHLDLDLSGLPAGWYFLFLRCNAGFASAKILVQP